MRWSDRIRPNILAILLVTTVLAGGLILYGNEMSPAVEKILASIVTMLAMLSTKLVDNDHTEHSNRENHE